MKRVWEGAGSLSLLEVTSVRGGVACNSQGRYGNNGCWPLSTSKIKVAIIAQILNIWRTGSFFAHPDSCTLCIVPQDMCKGPSLPLGVEGLQLTPEFQNSYMRQILLVQLLSQWGLRFLMLPTLLSSQSSFSIMWFLPFIMLMWYVTLIDLCILNCPCILRINPI